MTVDTSPMWEGQDQAVTFGVRRKKAINYIKPGLGKTRIYLEHWNRTCPDRVALVIGNKASGPAFISQAPRWCEQIRGRFDLAMLTGVQQHRKEKTWKH